MQCCKLHRVCSFSGSRSGAIHQHDVRVASHHVGSFLTHTQEVCGLQWSVDARYLASGANDNLLCIWDQSATGHSSPPLFTLNQHLAAVKVRVTLYFHCTIIMNHSYPQNAEFLARLQN